MNQKNIQKRGEIDSQGETCPLIKRPPSKECYAANILKSQYIRNAVETCYTNCNYMECEIYKGHLLKQRLHFNRKLMREYTWKNKMFVNMK